VRFESSVASQLLTARRGVATAGVLTRYTALSLSDLLVTKPEITVRTATESDLNFVSQDGYLPDPIMKRKVGDGDVYVALRDDEPVGYLRLEWLWSKYPYIELIFVLESHRRAGVGRALLTHVEAGAARRGHAALYSSSQADEPEPQAWHCRRGFEECGTLTGLNEGGVGEVFFRKSLAPTKGAV